MEDRLIYKIQRGYRGQFGSTESRHKEVDEELVNPGPGDYNPLPIIDEINELSSMKSKSKRKNLVNNDNPAPGAYNTNNLEISKKFAKEEEQDPDLVIKRPGFGTGEARFKQLP